MGQSQSDRVRRYSEMYERNRPAIEAEKKAWATQDLLLAQHSHPHPPPTPVYTPSSSKDLTPERDISGLIAASVIVSVLGIAYWLASDKPKKKK